ncbi:5, 10-methylenetetrahydrofolate reductase [Fructilactobacillus florum 8D]|uniref:Methylenetetrahydrofolate reductase n=1 Tax=Fructilactobacillus florum 8D TaxID=1221538 RepID=W9EG40_9LACO|nr:methylenetetrahydrofolate reductase [Fructilactobacillus florum]EKK21067.1 5, 10-methylenetetrahydrofolate reductase [Fructilactobacillus florum 2F]ETO41027.1 5, 10-methylenetetrahydrofolate reductase [Fructilactobacillus florum 8D]
MAEHQPSFSLELTPLGGNSEQQALLQSLPSWGALQPDFISITAHGGVERAYGAGFELATAVQQDLQIPALVHIAGQTWSPTTLKPYLEKLRAAELRHVLTIRGDEVFKNAEQQNFTTAANLAAFIRRVGGFDISGACYPHLYHMPPTELPDDLHLLQAKLSSGMTRLITQLFFDNEVFFAWQRRVRSIGIGVPILAGIFPVTSLQQKSRLKQLAGGSLPDQLNDQLADVANDPAAVQAVGIDYAVNQIKDLLARGVDGIHLYTMNNLEVTQKIYQKTQAWFNKSK